MSMCYGLCLVVGDSSEPSGVSMWVAAGGSMLTDVRRGRSLCNGNALSHLVCMQCIFKIKKNISFIIISKDEPCTLH